MRKNDQVVRGRNRVTARNTPERKVGLARAISKLGYCSRSKAAELIRAGQVRVNGVARKNVEAPVRIGKDRVEIDGRPVGQFQRIYLMMNKPRGVVTTASDERGRETVYACLDKYTNGNLPWVAPVGRLDKASEGLLLLTNDSEWAARITAPSTHVDKTYHVQLATQLTATQLQSLELGFTVKDGEFLRLKSAQLLRQGERNSWVEVILDEGRNRHIRRMFEKLGVEVLRLMRVSIGSLKLGELPKGAVRELSEKEALLLFTKSSVV
jgi:23S rRNA pseudouridine2605 synthase